MILDGEGYFLFMMMMNAALKMRELKKSKADFVMFAGEIWNSMEMNDEKALREIINHSMLRDIKNFTNNESK